MKHNDAYGGNYKIARAKALKRNPICQFCGRRNSTTAHHWALVYPSGADCTDTDLTALCQICHDIATQIRRLERTGGDIWKLMSSVKDIVAECSTK